MTKSMLLWHLARDNQVKLALFCDRNQIGREIGPYYRVEGDTRKAFTMKTYFKNGGYILAELLSPASISDHYQVLDYNLGEL